MGAHGVARLSKKNGQLEVMRVPTEGWTASRWVNFGLVDHTVVLSASREQRRFFDEETEAWCERPVLARLLERSPYYLARIRSDDTGTLWAAHFEGLVRYTPSGGDFIEDAVSFDLLNDRYPVVHVLPGNDIWVTASQSLQHVEASSMTTPRPVPMPVLVSLLDTRRGKELLPAGGAADPPLRLGFAHNSLAFRFFARSYAWRRAPMYEFRLGSHENWSTFETSSLLRFPELPAGDYRLEVRIAGSHPSANPTAVIPFQILPPWHRTGPAYLLFACLCIGAVLAAMHWSTHLARRRNRMLETMVQDRTAQLESTMQKLNEETRVSATLAERDRVAGEIHDSVQQGLTGAILQLETTLKLPVIGPELQERLQVVRNMVSYARQEVQHAVWDVESPLLEGADLGEALRKLTTYISSATVTPSVNVSGTPVPLPRPITHHLLRIAQEATTNALRHARANRIDLGLDYQAESVVLEIRDDGVGFNADEVLRKIGHFGVRGIRLRARKLQAELTIESRPGHGTHIRVRVPAAGIQPS
jgi:signal transduction histidine kinase